MSEVSIQTLSPQRVVSAVLRELNQEQIEDAVACFTKDIRYKDHGIGLEFKDKERLSEFFRKTRELYPDYSLQVDETFVSGEHVITQWTLQVTITEPFYAGLTRRLPISIAGVSIVRTDNGKIADWADYYDGSGRTLYGMGRILRKGESTYDKFSNEERDCHRRLWRNRRLDRKTTG